MSKRSLITILAICLVLPGGAEEVPFPDEGLQKVDKATLMSAMGNIDLYLKGWDDAEDQQSRQVLEDYVISLILLAADFGETRPVIERLKLIGASGVSKRPAPRWALLGSERRFLLSRFASSGDLDLPSRSIGSLAAFAIDSVGLRMKRNEGKRENGDGQQE